MYKTKFPKVKSLKKYEMEIERDTKKVDMYTQKLGNKHFAEVKKQNKKLPIRK